MAAPFSAIAVSNEFIVRARRDVKDISPLKLLKLVYFAYGWYEVLTGKPLFRERIEAWKFGPVVPAIYKAFRNYGSGTISKEAEVIDVEGSLRSGKILLAAVTIPKIDEDSSYAHDIIDLVWDTYRDNTAFQLCELTHRAGTAWDKAWNELGGKDRLGFDIDDKLIKEEFGAYLASAESQK